METSFSKEQEKEEELLGSTAATPFYLDLGKMRDEAFSIIVFPITFYTARNS